ncbi:MAG TPA: hypothetical protein VF138_12385 [Caulobacteraceae bacterium]
MSGRGTAGGVAFQRWFGAMAAAMMLTDRPMTRIAVSIPGVPLKIHFETAEPVDDLTIFTDRGAAYVQAKRQLALSNGEESELRSVANQFVAQYRTGFADGLARRPPDPEADRLVLAVGDATPNTVKADLKDALDRHASGAATAPPVKLSSALKIFRDHIQAAWLAQTGHPITAGEADAILRLCRVVVLTDAQESIATEALVSVVAAGGDETALFDVLCRWGADGSAVGAGGDSATLRAYLTGRIRLAAPADLRADTERLQIHSAAVMQRLQRFRTLRAPEGELQIDRVVTQAVVTAGRLGSFLVTGEPGAGKSAVLHAAAEELSASSPVIMLSVEATATSLDALRADLGLEKPLIDVLAAMPGERPAYLMIDALDAARGGLADSTYRQLLEAVSALDGWRVVASVRSFDLRMGKDLRRSFIGSPPDAAFAEPTFSTVRHLHVPLLDAAEIGQVEAASKTIGHALAAGGDKLHDLVRNPFNLGLLADLLSTGTDAEALAGVATRGQLLERYWLERVEDLHLLGLKVLSEVTVLMLDARSTSAKGTSLSGDVMATVEELVGRGVLVEEGYGRISFRHHVLFDYAVARVRLTLDEAEALRRLGRTEAAGLLLAPAVGYWLDFRFRRDAPLVFWRLAVHLMASFDIDPLARVQTSRLIVELVADTAKIQPLIELVRADAEGEPATAVAQLVGAIHTRIAAGGEVPVGPWAALAQHLPLNSRRLMAAERALISILVDRPGSAAHHAALNAGAVRLMQRAMAEPGGGAEFTNYVIPLVARTYAADPAASRKQLSAIFDQDRFERLGHIEAPALAREIRPVATADPDFTLTTYAKIFGDVDFDPNQTTVMNGSWILSLTSNARQDFQMARWALGEAYPALIKADFRLGARVLAAVLNEAARAKTRGLDPEVVEIDLDGKILMFVPDHSHVWGWNIDSDRAEELSKIYRGFLEWAKAAAEEDVAAAIALILEEGTTAISWRIALSAAEFHASTAVRVWPLASHRAVLRSSDTQQAAIQAVAAAYPHLTPEARQAFEEGAVGFDFPNANNPDEARSRFFAKIYHAIGDQHLVTEKATAVLMAARAASLPLANTRPVEFNVTGRTLAKHEWMRGDISTGANPQVLSLSDALEDLLAGETSPDTAPAMLTAMEALQKALRANAGELLPDADAKASDTLARAAYRLFEKELLSDAEFETLSDLVAQLAAHPVPEVDEETESRFASSPSWGSPSPRVEAAEALMLAVRRAGAWERLGPSVEALLRDPHPAVRLHVAMLLNTLWEADRAAMWRLLQQVAAEEPNAGVLSGLVDVVGRLRWHAPAESEALFLTCIARLTGDEVARQSYAALIVYFGIARDLPASRAVLGEWIDDFEQHEAWLSSVPRQCQDMITLAYDAANPEEALIRGRAQNVLRRILAAVKADVAAWPLRGGEPTSREIAAVKLLDGVADTIYFGAGAVGHADKLVFESEQGAADFLHDVQDIIRDLAALGTPKTVHHVLETLKAFIDADPELCFDLTAEALLRTTGVAKYEHESLGASLFVTIVGIYLADHRELFEEESRRQILVECLAVFVEAGWPEARRLFQSLPELFS